MKPVLFVTNLVAPDRVGALRALHARTPLELALFGGRSQHATAAVTDPGVPHRHVTQRAVHALAASGRYRAVVCGTAGRTALPAAWRGARRARVPFVLWSALWAHPRSPAHLAGSALLRALYRDADAVVAYGSHVAAFARAHGARRVLVAPQAVDNAWWAQPVAETRLAPFQALFVGRDTREKGSWVLREAWRASGLRRPSAALVLVGVGPEPPRVRAGDGVADPAPDGVHAVGPQPPEQVRNFLAGADVLVVPSLRTRTFREPWGLVANEAMSQSVPVIASDQVGAAAGGLVRDGRNGLVVAAGDTGALAGALRDLHDDPARRARLGAHARRDVAPFTFHAWAQAFEDALALP